MEKCCFFSILFLFLSFYVSAQSESPKYSWTFLSTEYGDLEMPGKGKAQTDCVVADFTGDGKDDFLIIEKTESPAIVMYLHKSGKKFEKFIIEKRTVQAGEASAIGDIDGDGDLDFAVASDSTNQIWWWENPYPNFEPDKTWKRNSIKKTGAIFHHDMVFGDFDGDKVLDLAFWNQGENSLYVAKKPGNVTKTDDWALVKIFSYNTDGQMFQRTEGSELKNIGVNFHEGICKADIDLDGIDDIVAGGMWFGFKNGKYLQNDIDKSFIAAKIDVGQIIRGGRPEVVMTPAEGNGPMVMYSFENGVWNPTILQQNLRQAHSLKVIDFDRDGDVDIVSAEMRTKEIADPKVFILFNNGSAVFERVDLPNPFGTHNTGVGDIDGDGDYDIIGKPFIWDSPRINIWLNDGSR